MTVLERFIQTNNGDWVGGNDNQLTISVKKIQSRFNPYYSRFHVLFHCTDEDRYKRNISLKSFANRHDAEIFAQKFVDLLNEENQP